MNNTQKLDDIRRRLRHMDIELTVIRRMTLLMCEYIKGPSDWYITPRERDILFGSERDWMQEFTGEAHSLEQLAARRGHKQGDVTSSHSAQDGTGYRQTLTFQSPD